MSAPSSDRSAQLDRLQREYTEAIDEFTAVSQSLKKQLSEFEASTGKPFLYRYEWPRCGIALSCSHLCNPAAAKRTR